MFSTRIKKLSKNKTLHLNDLAIEMKNESKTIYNLTAGQLPIKPIADFQEKIVSNLNFLKSFQYSPVAGVYELRKKLLKFYFDRKEMEIPENYSSIIGNGAKNIIFNILGCFINPGDEVILFKPYWPSYVEMVKFWGGKPIYIDTKSYESFIPHIEELSQKISKKTKLIILNSPNNPTGIY